MRIIAGLYRGRVLKTLPGLELRPTGDRLRETLFNVLGSTVQDSVFIDAYAGSGAVGLEALSRGSRQIFFIEESAASLRMIAANVAALGAGTVVEIVRTSVHKGLKLLEARGVRADFCFLDPPYAEQREYARSLLRLTTGALMKPEGLIVCEHSRKEPLEPQYGRWTRARVLTQGSSALDFYRRSQPDTEATIP